MTFTSSRVCGNNCDVELSHNMPSNDLWFVYCRVILTTSFVVYSNHDRNLPAVFPTSYHISVQNTDL